LQGADDVTRDNFMPLGWPARVGNRARHSALGRGKVQPTGLQFALNFLGNGCRAPKVAFGRPQSGEPIGDLVLAGSLSPVRRPRSTILLFWFDRFRVWTTVALAASQFASTLGDSVIRPKLPTYAHQAQPARAGSATIGASPSEMGETLCFEFPK
jgi:hypothetical protein